MALSSKPGASLAAWSLISPRDCNATWYVYKRSSSPLSVLEIMMKMPDDKRFVFLKAIKYMLPAISSVPLPITLPTTDNPRLRPVLKYIQENLGEPLTLETVGHAFSYSERTLTRLFRSTMDISFFQYLKLARMIKAMGYLLETEKTISEIAWDTGYNSVSAFSNTFYKLVGRRPSDFQP